jgi:hypothetical protein
MSETIWMREQLEAGKTAEVIAYLRALEDEWEQYASEQEQQREDGRFELAGQQLEHLCEEVAW